MKIEDGHITVRICVVTARDGTYQAAGWSDSSDHELRTSCAEAIDHEDCDLLAAYVTARVKVPLDAPAEEVGVVVDIAASS